MRLEHSAKRRLNPRPYVPTTLAKRGGNRDTPLDQSRQLMNNPVGIERCRTD